MSDDTQPRVDLRIGQAAKILMTHPATLRRWCNTRPTVAKQIGAYRVASGQLRFPRASVEQYAREMRG